MSRQFDLVVVGGGIVGLATAMNAIERFPHLRIALLEKESQPAAHQTGRNSGVIHSGLYYRPGSLKATMCVAGAAAMVQFCRDNGIPHEVCGKVVVATRESEFPALDELHRRATANGVPGVRVITPEELREYEPHCRGLKALHVPTTGITDYSKVAGKYAERFTRSGGEFHSGTEVIGFASGKMSTVLTKKGEFSTRALINCAGLHSDRVARMAGAAPGVQIVPFRGEYYTVAQHRAELVRGLIYPVPDARLPFLGVHFTRRITGEIEAGPNAVLAWKREGYTRSDFQFDDVKEMLSFPGFWRLGRRFWRSGVGEFYRSFSKRAFVRALQRLVPELGESDLAPGGSGVRAQAVTREGGLVDDFCIVGSANMIHVLNVPSPAATASLKIGQKIVEMAAERFDFSQATTVVLT